MSDIEATETVDQSERMTRNKYVTCHYLVAKTFGINQSILLEYLVEWGAALGWRYRKADDIEADTCLTHQEQRTARKKLIAFGVLEEETRGIPPIVHFRVKWDVVLKLMESTPDRGCNKSKDQFQQINREVSTTRDVNFNNSIKEVKVNGISERNDIDICAPTPTSNKLKPPPKKSPDIEGFDEWYGLYPRKNDRAEAQKAWSKLTPDDRSLAIEAIRRQRLWPQMTGEAKFIPLPTTWLHKRRWEDDPPPLTNGSPPVGSRPDEQPRYPLPPGRTWDYVQELRTMVAISFPLTETQQELLDDIDAWNAGGWRNGQAATSQSRG